MGARTPIEPTRVAYASPVAPSFALVVTPSTTPINIEQSALELVLTVNGVELTAAAFDEVLAIDQALAALLGQAAPDPRATLAQWINRTLLRQAVSADVSADVSAGVLTVDDARALDVLLTQHNLSEDDLTQALTAAGVDEAGFRAYFAELLYAQHIAPTVSVTEQQRAARISFGPRAAALFGQDTAQPVLVVKATPVATIEQVEMVATVKGTAPAPPMEIRGTAPGLLAPDFILSALPDEPADDWAALSFADLLGAPTVLSFWTTWCPYCRRQTPVLVDAHHRYASNNVRFVGINVKEEAALVRAYVEDNQIPYAIALDAEGSTAEEFLVRGFPTTYFLDANGRVVARHIGQLTTELLDDYVSRLLLDSVNPEER